MSTSSMDFVQDKLMPAIQNVQENKFVKAITQGMMGTMPILMGAAIFQLFYSLPIPGWEAFLQSTGIYNVLTRVVDICNLTALYMAFGIGRKIGEFDGIDPFASGMTALVCFLVITPIEIVEGGWSPTKLINLDSLGGQAIITAMIVGLLAPSIYAWVFKKHWTIKMPDSVPEFVAKSFEGIIPSFLTLLPFIVLRGAFAATSFGSFTNFIYTIIQTPLTSVGNSFGGHLILMIVCCLLWWCGIHGTMVIIPIMSMMMNPALLENIDAVNMGLPAPNLLSFLTFFVILQFIGGPGCMLGLNIDLAFFTKSERYKAQGKLCLVPGFFNIIEPTVYGLPVVLNPLLLPPLIAAPVIIYILFYICLKIGFFLTPVVNVGIMVMPAPIIGFLLGGGVGLGIFLIAMIPLSMLIYYPFVKILDNQELKKETAEAAA